MLDPITVKRLGGLGDIQFKGVSWKDSDLHLEISGHDYSGLICKWAYDFIVNLNWASENNKRGGPSLSWSCLLYTSPSPRDGLLSRMPSSA